MPSTIHHRATGHHGHRPAPDLETEAAGPHAHSSSDRHAGHGAHGEVFRRLFWWNLVLAIPIVVSSEMVQEWFGYELTFWGADAIAPVLGTLVFLPASVQQQPRSLVWIDRNGVQQPIPVESRPYAYPRVSPDGRRVALDVRGNNRDIWILDLEPGLAIAAQSVGLTRQSSTECGNLNGLGLLFVQAIAHRDYTLTQALVLLVATAFIVVNFLVDLAFAWIDPRIRYR